jgi:membrane protease YdiL (CAAX protease family)
MNWQVKARIWREAVLISAGFMLFSFFIHYPMPLKLLAYAALVFSSLRISKKWVNLSEFNRLAGCNVEENNLALYTSAGCLAGIFLAIAYRDYLGTSLLPVKLGLFVLAAALIGGTEEFVFRGFLQGYTRQASGWGSVIFSSLAHTGYKWCLFISTAASNSTDLITLALWTFVAGILFGTLRHLSGSIFPPVAGHAIFDIIVYGEYSQAPWWVW